MEIKKKNKQKNLCLSKVQTNCFDWAGDSRLLFVLILNLLFQARGRSHLWPVCSYGWIQNVGVFTFRNNNNNNKKTPPPFFQH